LTKLEVETDRMDPSMNRKENTMSTQLSKAENRPAKTAGDSPDVDRYLTPRVDVIETKDGYRLEAEMPGVSKKTLELSLDGNELTITGRRPARLENVESVYRESSPLGFRRVFELDPSIDAAKVSAKMEQGVLLLTLPKADRVKPRKIAVTD
jgi:HSP20 family protein